MCRGGWKFTEEADYRRIRGWWDRKGENEIDMVCENALDGRLDFYEVKIDSCRLDMSLLNRKVEAFLTKNPNCRQKIGRLGGLSCDDM